MLVRDTLWGARCMQALGQHVWGMKVYQPVPPCSSLPTRMILGHSRLGGPSLVCWDFQGSMCSCTCVYHALMQCQ